MYGCFFLSVSFLCHFLSRRLSIIIPRLYFSIKCIDVPFFSNEKNDCKYVRSYCDIDVHTFIYCTPLCCNTDIYIFFFFKTHIHTRMHSTRRLTKYTRNFHRHLFGTLFFSVMLYLFICRWYKSEVELWMLVFIR